MSFYRPLFFALFLFSLGCASITNRHQYVRVVPDSPKTEILFKEEKVGVGASTVRITRSKHPTLIYKKDGKEKPHNLDTTYRWGHSFVGNILLYPYTPIGWLADYATGASWEAIDEVAPNQEFPLNEKSKILILPPTGTNAVDSRLMGRRVLQWIQVNLPGMHALPFEETYNKMVGMGFDHESSDVPDDLDGFNDLLHETQATHLVFSEYNPTTEKLHLQFVSPYNEKVVKKITLKKVESQARKSTWDWLSTEFFEVVPNTISLGTNEVFFQGCATQPDESLLYCPDRGERSPLSYLSSLSLTSVLHHRKRDTWGVYLRFNPDFTITFNELRFAKASASLPDLYLDWAYTGLGYGPRLSFILPVGEAFLEFIPFLAMNYLRLHSEQNYDQTQWVGKLGVTAQVGLNSWISDYWNLRFFVKGQSQELLKHQDISVLDPGTQFDGGLTIIQTGIAIGYYFEEEKTRFFDWMGWFD